jgi:hypothetical protein
MADRELTAALLAAALIQKSDRVPLSINVGSAERVVEAYRLVLAQLARTEPSDAARGPAIVPAAAALARTRQPRRRIA